MRQFLDVGAGLPTADNTHEVAQRVAPESRVVYVDSDPLVLAHGRALLTSSPEGTATYVDANLGDPAKVLHEAAKWLDLTQPVALRDEENRYGQWLGERRDPLEGIAVLAGGCSGRCRGGHRPAARGMRWR
jgi:S-adenosyl methyltransferase